MCFSANASITAGVVLTVIGSITLHKSKQKNQYLFAAIPFIFGLQQFSEGVLWLTLPKAELHLLQKYATYSFLIFAQIIWPMLVPISVLLLEKNKSRILTLKVLVGIGIAVGLYLTFCLIWFNVSAIIESRHILYIQHYPVSIRNGSIVLYALATIVPPLFSSIRGMWLLGLTIFVSYIFSALFYEHYVLSVWCFFSSILSIGVYFMIKEVVNEKKYGL
jgi:hypothetical protein